MTKSQESFPEHEKNAKAMNKYGYIIANSNIPQ